MIPEYFPSHEEQKITLQIFTDIKELALGGLSSVEREAAELPYPEDDSRPELYDHEYSATPIWQHAPGLAETFELSLTAPIACLFLPRTEVKDPRFFEHPCCAIALTCNSASPFDTLQYMFFAGEALCTIEKGIEFAPLPDQAPHNVLPRLLREANDIERWQQELENTTVNLEELQNLAELVALLRKYEGENC